ncbi:MAG: hypothetical protein JRC86_09955, partial [Deltaproteobacteria bacterium]|nr:hypothetical protein [Deltaproteobacteria bacterium]
MSNMHPTIDEWYKDPEFKALPDEKKVQAIDGLFDSIATDEFYQEPIETQAQVRSSFINDHLPSPEKSKKPKYTGKEPG